MDSIISLNDFEVLPDTPGSLRGCQVNMEDFEEASPLSQAFCDQLTLEKYEEQCSSHTDKAIKDLVNSLQNDPSLFFRVIQKRKLEDLEQSGMVSFLKTKFLLKLHGEKFQKNVLTAEECDQRLKDVLEGMTRAHAYSEEIKERKQYNTRLTAKRKLLQQTRDASTTQIPPAPPCPQQNHSSQAAGMKCPPAPKLPRKHPLAAPPPPPPTYPPPVATPLRDRTNIMKANDSLERPPIKKPFERTDSMASVASLHEELLSANPLKRLRSTQNRSPRGTPQHFKRLRRSTESLRFETPARVMSPGGEPLTSMLLRIMEQKFRHVRSPSPSTPRGSSLTNSPQTGFTP